MYNRTFVHLFADLERHVLSEEEKEYLKKKVALSEKLGNAGIIHSTDL